MILLRIKAMPAQPKVFAPRCARGPAVLPRDYLGGQPRQGQSQGHATGSSRNHIPRRGRVAARTMTIPMPAKVDLATE